MPEIEEKKKEPMVDIDTSSPDTEVDLPEVKPDGTVIEELVAEETKEPVKEESVREDDKLADYSKGVQSRIAKLTKKMR